MKYWVFAVVVLLFSSNIHAVTIDEYLDEARQFLKQRDFSSAVIQLKNALQDDPKNADARFLLAQVYLEAGDGASAEKEIRRAKSNGMAPEKMQLELGQAYLLQGKNDDIIREINANKTQETTVKAEILALRGRAFLRKREFDRAKEEFDRALAIERDQQDALVGLVRVALASGQQEEGMVQIDALLEKHPNNEQALVIRGELLRRSSKIDEALIDFTKAIDLNPNSTPALLGRLMIHLYQRSFELAEVDLKKLERIAPRNVIVLYLKGVYSFQQGQLEQAEISLARVLEFNPNHAQSQLLYGATKYAQGEAALADEYVTQALKRLPDSLPAIKLSAAARIKLGQRDRAIEVLEPAAKRFPNDAQLAAMLGNAYLQNGDYQKGSEQLSKAIELSPDLASLRTQLAFGLLVQGNTNEAISELQSAVDLGQDLIEADILLVLSHLKRKEIDQALTAALALEKRMPENPIAHNLSGLAYLAGSKREEARAKFKKALELDPTFVTAEINLARMDLGEGKWDQAEASFRSVLEKTPENMSALLGMAAISEQRIDRKQVYHWLELAQDKNPDSSKPGLLLAQAYLNDGDKLKAFNITSDLATRFPDEEAVMRMQGRAQLMAGESNSAASTFRKLVEKYKSTQNLMLLAMAEGVVKNFDAARNALEQILQIQPDYLPAQLALARLEFSSGRRDAALASAMELKKLHPQKSAGYEIAGAVLMAEEKRTQAIEEFEKAYELQPSAKLAVQLARLHYKFGLRENSVSILQDWLQRQPEDVNTRIAYAVLLQNMRQMDDAAVQYEKALEGAPNNLTALNNLAWIYQTKGDKRAMELAARAYEVAPNRPEVIDTYGWALFNLGSPEKGLALVQEALALAPDHPEIGYHVGYALFKTGRNNEAGRVLRATIKANPNSAFAVKAREVLEKIN